MENKLTPEEKAQQDAVWNNVMRINRQEPMRLDKLCLLFSWVGPDTFSLILNFATPNLALACITGAALTQVQDRTKAQPPHAELLQDFSTVAQTPEDLTNFASQNPAEVAKYLAKLLDEGIRPDFA